MKRRIFLKSFALPFIFPRQAKVELHRELEAGKLCFLSTTETKVHMQKIWGANYTKNLEIVQRFIRGNELLIDWLETTNAGNSPALACYLLNVAQRKIQPR